MIVHQIKYFKNLIEERITGRDGTGTPLAGRFFEIYPSPSVIKRSLPCACLRHLPGKTSFSGGFDRTEQSGNEIRKIRKIHEAESGWQIDFYSKDIYDFIEADETYTGCLNQFLKHLSELYRVTDPKGNAIEFESGTFGVIDDEEMIVDGIYKAYCQVKAVDGIYSIETVAALPGNEDNIIISEELNV
jgi:hypothetical protein